MTSRIKTNNENSRSANKEKKLSRPEIRSNSQKEILRHSAVHKPVPGKGRGSK